MSGPPAVVALGGGHGLAVTLTAALRFARTLTAVVSVADDGGSSGRLRRELGILAPGDMRRCLAALAPPGPARAALDHRFEQGTLAGHAAGNVLLAALLRETRDPVAALDAAAEMVRARGRVLPAALEPVDLLADTDHGVVRGQVAVGKAGRIDRIHTVPADPAVPAEVVAAIGAADLVIVGPGSLYTSVLAAALPAIRDAIAGSEALVVYVANLAPEAGETPAHDLADLVGAVRRHGIEPDIVLADDAVPVPGDLAGPVVGRRLAAAQDATHDPELLGEALSELIGAVTN